MGQYYIGVNLTKKEMIVPSGLKMLEHSWIGNETMKRLENLLLPGNAWYKNRIVWAGDYADANLFTRSKKKNLWESARNFKSADSIPLDGPDIRFIINHTKKLYIDLNNIRSFLPIHDQEKWIIHPLPLLISIGSNDNGGDYYSTNMNYDRVGSWAGDVISSDYTAPKKMEQYVDFFL